MTFMYFDPSVDQESDNLFPATYTKETEGGIPPPPPPPPFIPPPPPPLPPTASSSLSSSSPPPPVIEKQDNSWSVLWLLFFALIGTCITLALLVFLESPCLSGFLHHDIIYNKCSSMRVLQVACVLFLFFFCIVLLAYMFG